MRNQLIVKGLIMHKKKFRVKDAELKINSAGIKWAARIF
jgi:hypothetical protein